MFRAEVNGRVLTFFHTNMVGMNFTFADRETETRWQQETGEAIEGTLKGRRLEIYPFRRTLTFDLGASSRALVDAETGSRWNAYGECLDGALRGSQLKPLIGVRQFWWAWAAFFPGTDIDKGRGSSVGPGLQAGRARDGLRAVLYGKF